MHGKLGSSFKNGLIRIIYFICGCMQNPCTRIFTMSIIVTDYGISYMFNYNTYIRFKAQQLIKLIKLAGRQRVGATHCIGRNAFVLVNIGSKASVSRQQFRTKLVCSFKSAGTVIAVSGSGLIHSNPHGSAIRIDFGSMDLSRDGILGHQFNKRLKSFAPCFS
jgi:hypothetical protein